MSVTTNDIKEIASRGGGMILDASRFSAEDLKEIASRASTKDHGFIILRNSVRLSAEDAKEIASRSQGHVILDFTIQEPVV